MKTCISCQAGSFDIECAVCIGPMFTAYCVVCNIQIEIPVSLCMAKHLNISLTDWCISRDVIPSSPEPDSPVTSWHFPHTVCWVSRHCPYRYVMKMREMYIRIAIWSVYGSLNLYLFIFSSASPIIPVPVGMMTPSPAVCTNTAEMFVLVSWE